MQNWRNERDERDEGSGSRERERDRDREGQRYSARSERDERWRDERGREGRDLRSEEDRRWEDETREGRGPRRASGYEELEPRGGRESSQRGMRFQDEYDDDRTRRGMGYGGREQGRDWAPGGGSYRQPGQQSAFGQQSYQPSWGWESTEPQGGSRQYGGQYSGQYGGQSGGPYAAPHASQTYAGPYEGGQYDTRSYSGSESFGGREHHHGFGRGILQRIKEFVGRGPKGYTRTDERILDDVCERLAQGYLDSSDIEVTVASGEVVLDGTVRSKADRRLAEDLIEDTLGVKDINNKLKVKRLEAGEHPAHPAPPSEAERAARESKQASRRPSS